MNLRRIFGHITSERVFNRMATSREAFEDHDKSSSGTGAPDNPGFLGRNKMDLKSPFVRALAAIPAIILLSGCATLSWPVVEERAMPELDQELVAAIDRQIMASGPNSVLLGAFDDIGFMMYEQREYIVRNRMLDHDDETGLFVGVTPDAK